MLTQTKARQSTSDLVFASSWCLKWLLKYFSLYGRWGTAIGFSFALQEFHASLFRFYFLLFLSKYAYSQLNFLTVFYSILLMTEH